MTIKALFLAGMTAVLTVNAASAKDLRSIGLTLGSLGNPYFLALVDGATKQAKTINPAVKVNAVSSEYDLGKQSSQIDNFIASGVDLILVAAADPKAIGSAVQRAQAAGVTVIAVDVEADKVDATVQTDNKQAGAISCDYLVSKIGGKGNVIIESGPPTSSVLQRVEGCKMALAAYPDIKILSDNQNGKVSREGGKDVMLSYLTRFPNIQGVFTIADPQAIGSILAIKQLSRSGILVTSVDGSPDAVEAMRSDTPLQASAAQDPAGLGWRAVQIGYDIMNGKKPENRVTQLPPILVTRDNVNGYKGW
ncbi:ABC transporter substrate-binding protein [Beijerinckia indica]|uniref:Periplasmic binding protein/LacI transcriptional regulator n=1 Tax=Beijerinckia indica subsp. indica (strain ATCC 9039 / DSM 1715 / NCIMB 8712) TaxID=395963 RepID=B2IHG8_BEII9|nr:ABC transporter substrate-binding protein [Beijerinckia indica]ACB95953.1 periplasmic binding protein/LacI transcriptional regulator [Beijerinckia indica subsp. indica ATCC 9039]